MKFYYKNCFSKKEEELFLLIRFAVERVKEPNLGKDKSGQEIAFSSHILSHALSKIFPVTAIDGVFAGAYRHSWLTTKYNSLIDVLPISCIGGPIMFDNSSNSPKKRLYKPTSLDYSEKFSSPSFCFAVDVTTIELENVLRSAGVKVRKEVEKIEFC